MALVKQFNFLTQELSSAVKPATFWTVQNGNSDTQQIYRTLETTKHSLSCTRSVNKSSDSQNTNTGKPRIMKTQYIFEWP